MMTGRPKGFLHWLRREWPKFRMRHIDRGRLRRPGNTLVVESTNVCTLHCSCCPNGVDRDTLRPRATLTLASFREILPNLDIIPENIFLHLHGEPLLNRDLPEIAAELQRRGARKFTMFSNAQKVDTDVLDRLLTLTPGAEWKVGFSMEIFSPRLYEATRCGGRHADALESLDRIDAVMARHGIDYTINAIIDAEAVEEARARAKEIFSRYSRLGDIGFSNRFPWPHLPQTGDLIGTLRPHANICSQLWDLPAVTASGDVTLCSSDYRGEAVVGNLHDAPYSRLINNAAARRFRLNLALRRPERNAMCRGCLIPRFTQFQRTLTRKFALSGSEENLKRYFDSFLPHLNRGKEVENG